MAGGKRRRSRQQWRALVEGWEASDLSQKAYCEREGVAPRNWRRWRRRFQEEPEGAGSEAATPARVRLVPVELIGGDEPSGNGCALPLALGDGMRIEVPPGFDGATLRRLLGIVREAP